jgi:hypothetical protein
MRVFQVLPHRTGDTIKIAVIRRLFLTDIAAQIAGGCIRYYHIRQGIPERYTH